MSHHTRRLKMMKLDVIQYNCPLVDASRDLGLYMEITSAALHGDYSLLLIWISGKSVKRFLRGVRDDERVKRYHVLYKDRDSAWVYMVKKSSGILKTIYESQGLLASSIIVSRGVKRFNVILPSNNLRILRRRIRVNLEDNGMKVYVNDISNGESGNGSLLSLAGVHVPFSFVRVDVLSKLTDIEREVLHDALEEGYFEWPRRKDLTMLSNKHGVSKATLSYHLRMAEKKILRVLSHKYGLFEE